MPSSRISGKMPSSTWSMISYDLSPNIFSSIKRSWAFSSRFCRSLNIAVARYRSAPSNATILSSATQTADEHLQGPAWSQILWKEACSFWSWAFPGRKTISFLSHHCTPAITGVRQRHALQASGPYYVFRDASGSQSILNASQCPSWICISLLGNVASLKWNPLRSWTNGTKFDYQRTLNEPAPLHEKDSQYQIHQPS